MHPVPLVTHPLKLVAHALSVVEVVSSEHLLSTQGVVAVAVAVFQHFLPAPVKAAQVVYVPKYLVQGSVLGMHPLPLVTHPAKKELQAVSLFKSPAS